MASNYSTVAMEISDSSSSSEASDSDVIPLPATAPPPLPAPSSSSQPKSAPTDASSDSSRKDTESSQQSEEDDKKKPDQKLTSSSSSSKKDKPRRSSERDKGHSSSSSRHRSHHHHRSHHSSRSSGKSHRRHRSRSHSRDRHSRSSRDRRSRSPRGSRKDRDYSHRRSRSRSRSRDFDKKKFKKPDFFEKAAKLGATGLLGSDTSRTTPGLNSRELLKQTMEKQLNKVKELTGVELPKYYNLAGINPLKYAEQIKKRKLLWGNKEKKEEGQSAAASSSLAPATVPSVNLLDDTDGAQQAKFMRLMGVKSGEEKEVISKYAGETVAKQNETLFSDLDRQYEVARLTTHTQRGVGLGFSSSSYIPMQPKG